MRRMRLITSIVLTVSMVISGLLVQPQEAAAASIKLNKKKLTLAVGQSYTLKLKKGASVYKKGKVKWSSSNKKIASVSKAGKVKAKKTGSAKITAKLSGKKYVCKLTVKKQNTSTAKPSTPAQSAGAEQPTATVIPTSPASAPPAGNTAQPPANPSKLPVNPSEAPAQPSDSDLPPESPDVSTGPALQETQSPAPTQTIPPTPLPDNTFVPSEQAAKVDVVPQKYSQHILLTVTNRNEEWMDSIQLECIFEDAEGYYVMEETISLPLMMPGEMRKIAVASDAENIAAVSLKESNINVTVEQMGIYGTYEDKTDSVSMLQDNFDEEMRTYSFTLSNQSQEVVSGTYICYLYDEQESIYDVISAPYEITEESDITEYIDLSPYEIMNDTEEGISSYLPIKSCAVEFVARSFTEVDRLAELAQQVSVTWSRSWESCVEVTVKNNNDVWLSSVQVQATFYDSQNQELDSGEGQLLSIGPNESMTLLLPVSSENVSAIARDATVYDVTVEEDTEGYVYSKASESEIPTTIAKYGEHDCIVTLQNKSENDIEGTCIVYFVGTGGRRFDASQLTFQVSAGDTEELFWESPYEINDEGEEVSRVVSYAKTVVAHKVQEKE